MLYRLIEYSACVVVLSLLQIFDLKHHWKKRSNILCIYILDGSIWNFLLPISQALIFRLWYDGGEASPHYSSFQVNINKHTETHELELKTLGTNPNKAPHAAQKITAPEPNDGHSSLPKAPDCDGRFVVNLACCPHIRLSSEIEQQKKHTK